MKMSWEQKHVFFCKHKFKYKKAGIKYKSFKVKSSPYHLPPLAIISKTLKTAIQWQKVSSIGCFILLTMLSFVSGSQCWLLHWQCSVYRSNKLSSSPIRAFNELMDCVQSVKTWNTKKCVMQGGRIKNLVFQENTSFSDQDWSGMQWTMENSHSEYLLACADETTCCLSTIIASAVLLLY